MNDKKKNVALIVKGMTNPDMKEAPQSEEGGEIDNSIAIDTAAEEIMSAMESKDPKSLVSALKSFMELCKEEEPEYSEEMPE